MRRGPVLRTFLSLAALCVACEGDGGGGGASATLTVTSGAFADGAAIPGAYTCDGEGLSPPLAWAGTPADTRSFALTVEDPDVPADDGTTTLDHWVVYDLPATTTALAEGAAAEALPAGAQVATSWFAPCPPDGATHRYRFRVYAVDTVLGVAPAALTEGLGGDETAADRLREELEGHVLAEGVLTGNYE